VISKGLAVWLYGSQARGDADPLSDVDALVVSDEAVNPAMLAQIDVRLQIGHVSEYSWNEIEGMASYGSLFLLHVRKEGHCLFESADARGRLEQLLTTIGSYQLAQRDVRAFRVVVNDVRKSLASGSGSPSYELATLGTVFRHASILGCYLAGMPTFSRTAPVTHIVATWNLPELWADEFPALYAFRMYAAGRIANPPPATRELAERWSDRAGRLIGELEERVNAVS